MLCDVREGRNRQTAHKDKDKGRSSKRMRRALEVRVADRDVGARVDAREQPEYGLRGRDDTDEYFAEHKYDTIWGDTVVRLQSHSSEIGSPRYDLSAPSARFREL